MDFAKKILSDYIESNQNIKSPELQQNIKSVKQALNLLVNPILCDKCPYKMTPSDRLMHEIKLKIGSKNG
jgi:hypothetical protein